MLSLGIWKASLRFSHRHCRLAPTNFWMWLVSFKLTPGLTSENFPHLFFTLFPDSLFLSFSPVILAVTFILKGKIGRGGRERVAERVGRDNWVYGICMKWQWINRWNYLIFFYFLFETSLISNQKISDQKKRTLLCLWIIWPFWTSPVSRATRR